MESKPGTWTLVFLFLCSPSFGSESFTEENRLEYALRLFAERDYYRSITQLKQIEYLTRDETTRAWCTYKMGEAYFKSGKYKNAIRYLDNYMKQETTGEITARAHMYLGAGFFHMSRHDRAGPHFNEAANLGLTGSGMLWDGYNSIYSRGLEGGIEAFQSLGSEFETGAISRVAPEIVDILNAHQGSRLRPRLASALSVFVPGLGQWYARHYYDAVQSFVLVGGFSYMAHASYRLGTMGKQSHLITGLSMVVAGMFHYGNVLGAGRTAVYRNMRNQDNALRRIRLKITNVSNFSLEGGFSIPL